MKKKLTSLILAGCICLSGAYGGTICEQSAHALSIIASVTSISIKKDVIAIGEKVQLELEWSTGAKQELFYKSSDESVLTVDSKGVVTGISDGTATVTVSHSNMGKDKTIDITVSGDVEISTTYNTSELELGTKLKKYDTLHYDGKSKGSAANIINTKGSYDPAYISISDYVLPFDAEIVGIDGLYIYIAPQIDGITYLDGRTLSVGDVIDRNTHLLCYDYHINKMVLPVFLPEYYGKYIGDGTIKVKDINHEKKTLTLESVDEVQNFVKGDVNADGDFTVADVVMLQKWLLAVPDVTLPNWKAADLCEDGTLNVFDLCMMKRELVNTVTESNHNIYSEKRIDMIGYSDKLWEINNSDKSSAIITCTEELRTYLSQITEKRVIDPMLDKYNDSFFNDNVLLVKCIFQSCGGDNMYQIDSVQYKGDSLVVNYSDNYDYESYIDVVNVLLAQVVIPKKNYHADSVEWRFTAYLDTPLLMVNEEMIKPVSQGWGYDYHNRVITAGGSRYTAGAVMVPPDKEVSLEDFVSMYMTDGEKEWYIKDEGILKSISEFAENADKYKNCTMQKSDVCIYDYGQISLSVLYRDENGTMQSLELYRYGSEIACLDNDDVHNLVKMLIEHGYIEGETFWEDSIDAEKPVITMADVLELSNKDENLIWSDFENYQHGEDIGSGIFVYEFKIADYSNRFTLTVGYSDENSLQYVRLKSSESTIDITESSENDIKMFIAEHNPPA